MLVQEIDQRIFITANQPLYILKFGFDLFTEVTGFLEPLVYGFVVLPGLPKCLVGIGILFLCFIENALSLVKARLGQLKLLCQFGGWLRVCPALFQSTNQIIRFTERLLLLRPFRLVILYLSTDFVGLLQSSFIALALMLRVDSFAFTDQIPLPVVSSLMNLLNLVCDRFADLFGGTGKGFVLLTQACQFPLFRIEIGQPLFPGGEI